MSDESRPPPRPQLRVVLDGDTDSVGERAADAAPTTAAEREAEVEQEGAARRRAPADAMEALLLAKRGYQAAVAAADGARLPSLTDFVD